MAEERFNDIEFENIVNRLVDQKIVEVQNLGNNTFNIDINLEKPSDAPFWEEYDVDKYQNVIYSHPSNYTGSLFTLELELWNNKIQYHAYHTEYGSVGTYESLKDAQEAVEKELKLELKEIGK